MGRVAFAAIAVLLGGCGSQRRCVQGCPDVSGAFRVLTNTVQGSCSFVPYLLGPSLELVQAPGSGQVSTSIIDPSTQLPFLLVGELFLPDSGEDANSVGRVVSHTQTSRAATPSGVSTLALNVDWVARVYVREGLRHLSGNLATTDLGGTDGGLGCTVQLDFVAQE